jgi:hypothetical protein
VVLHDIYGRGTTTRMNVKEQGTHGKDTTCE